MADCIPIHYAPNRAHDRFTVNKVLTENNSNTAVIDQIRDVLIAGGWTVTGNRKATGSAFYIIPLPTAGDGRSGPFLTFQNQVFYIYDPLSTFIPTGYINGMPIIPVASGSPETNPLLPRDTNTYLALCGAASGGGFTWTFDPNSTPSTITVTAHADGTGGNGEPYFGIQGVSGATSNGGWTLTSAAANGVSSVSMSIYGGGNSGAGVWMYFTLNGHDTTPGALGDLFAPLTYDIYVNSYQMMLFKAGNQNNGAIAIVCAPWVHPDFVTLLGYTGFVSSATRQLAGDVHGFNAGFIEGASLFMDGTYHGGFINALLWRYENFHSLSTSFGKPLAYEHHLMMPMTSRDMVYVGAMWDVWVESTEQTPEVDRIEYDGHDWRVAFTQAIGTATTGTIWLAIS